MNSTLGCAPPIHRGIGRAFHTRHGDKYHGCKEERWKEGRKEKDRSQEVSSRSATKKAGASAGFFCLWSRVCCYCFARVGASSPSGASPHTYAMTRGAASTAAPREMTIPIGSSLGTLGPSNVAMPLSPNDRAMITTSHVEWIAHPDVIEADEPGENGSPEDRRPAAL